MGWDRVISLLTALENDHHLYIRFDQCKFYKFRLLLEFDVCMVE